MTSDVMISDLRDILHDWDYEPGKISVRKIIGRDGCEKIQTRIDLGLLQFEPEGRPDGGRPHGCESLLEFHERRLVETVQRCGSDEDFVLSPEDCRELRHEGYLYYQRYLSFFVLEEFDNVRRDTARKLRLMDFCGRYAGTDYDRTALEPQRPYVVMMYTRARAYLAWEDGRPEDALRTVEGGLRRVSGLLEARGEDPDSLSRSETRLLHELREEIIDDLDADSPMRLRLDLDEAIAIEDFERAAALRDRLEQIEAGAYEPDEYDSDDDAFAGD